MDELIREGSIQVDRIKCAEWPDMIAAAKPLAPVYVHFRLLAGQGRLTEAQLDNIAKMREETDTPFINTHIAPRISDVSAPNDFNAVYDVVVRDITQLVDRFGADYVIAENIPYPEGDSNEPKVFLGSDAAFIHRVIEDTGVGLLLDIGHAKRTAEHLAFSPILHIEQLPVHRLREVHITGLGYKPNGQRTDHMPMREDDWELLQWALDNIREGNWAKPWSVSCEYGGLGAPFKWRSEKAVIAREAPRMWQMVHTAPPVKAVG
jgi:uncharacterized protein (UPF0276 family)